MRIFKLILLLGLATSFSKRGSAQVDPHFSQYYVYPSWLNPALTGAFDGNYRVAGIYRSQWSDMGSPFTASGLSADLTTGSNINVGVSLLNQSAANGGYSYTTAYGSIAYTGVRFGPEGNHRVVIGLQGGIIDRRFNAAKLTFGDQWNPVTGYSPSNPTSDLIARPRASSFDAGAGIMYFDATPERKANVFAGVSVSHLTKPTDQFSASGESVIPIRVTGHAGIRIALADNFSLTPNVLYLRQGTAEEKMVGAFGQLKAAPGTDLLIGANYRFNDALSPYAGFTFRNMVLGVSYDINQSQMSRMTRGANSFEISLSFIGRKTAKTPELEFVCPSL